MKFARLTGAALLAWAALAASAPAWAGESMTRVFAKAGGTAAQMKADLQFCTQVGRGSADYRGGSTPYGLGGDLIATGLANGSIVEDTIRACMGQKGWAAVALTTDEAGALSHRQGAAADAWLDAFYASGIESRVAAALPEPFQPLPAGAWGPDMVGALRIDPARAVAATGVVKVGEPVLTGVADHRATARLTRDLDAKAGFARAKAKAGTIVFQLDFISEAGVHPTWCGVPPPGPNALIWCFSERTAYYNIFITRGRPWLGVVYTPALTLAGDAPLRTVSPIFLERTPDDALGPVDYVLKLVKLKDDRLRLDAVATRGKQQVVFWSADLTFDAGGQARMPFVSRTLVLTRAEGGVTARLEEGGDGHGWPPMRQN